MFLPNFSISLLIFFLELSEGLLAFRIEVDKPVGSRSRFCNVELAGLCNKGGPGIRERSSIEVRSFSLPTFWVNELAREVACWLKAWASNSWPIWRLVINSSSVLPCCSSTFYEGTSLGPLLELPISKLNLPRLTL